MARRIHVPHLSPGDIPLDPAQAHHARDVLRLASGAVVDVFDDAGATAVGVLHHLAVGTIVRVAEIAVQHGDPPLQWTIAAAVPKGDRADWMVEKLSEIGAAAFIPLATARSVVHPAGKNKWERWSRLATESAKQSRRVGVMRIDELTPVNELVKRLAIAKSPGLQTAAAWVLSTEAPAAIPIAVAVSNAKPLKHLTMLIGPEGGWTEEELAAFAEAGVIAVRLGASILRVETAAIAAGAVVSAFMG